MEKIEKNICFQYNKETNELSKAKYHKHDVTIWKSPDGKGIVHSPVIEQPITLVNCEYFTCLEVEQAIKHFTKILGTEINPIII